jgi:hypothetical protein
MQKALGETQELETNDSAFLSMMYDTESRQLITGGARPQLYVKKGSSLIPTKHNYVAMAVCHQKNLIAVADDKNEIILWRVGSGRQVFSFSGCDKDQGAVTSLAFDHEFSRLLVGCTNGHVRLFNYGNGLLLKQYALRGSADISGLCSVLEQGEVLLYGGTESAEVYMWKDTEESTTLRPIVYDRLNSSAHELDVSCLVHVPPDYLITCSFDGRVVVWQRGVHKHTLTDPQWAERPIMSRGMQKVCFLPYKYRTAPNAATAAPAHRSSALQALEGTQKRLHIIAAAGTDGRVHLWNLSAPLAPAYLFAVAVFRQTKTSFGVVQMCSDDSQSFLCCGDAQVSTKVHLLPAVCVVCVCGGGVGGWVGGC